MNVCRGWTSEDDQSKQGIKANQIIGIWALGSSIALWPQTFQLLILQLVIQVIRSFLFFGFFGRHQGKVTLIGFGQ